jgi:glycosyltransferase involved in cell wall biosynthesis
MNICSPQLGLSPKSILGGEVFDVEILEGLAKKGCKIDVILPKGLLHIKSRNISITYLPIAHFPAILFNLLVLPYLFKVNKKNKIQILRLHQPQFLFLAALIFKIFNPQVKIVATYHQFNETKFGLLTKTLNNYWDHIICDSFAVKENLKDNYGVAPDKITVVHNGVPDYLWPEKKDKNVLSKFRLKNKNVLLFVGLFIQRKNPLFLLDVLKNIIRTTPNTVLVFWGKGPLKQEIQQKALKLKIQDKVIFFEPTYGPEKRKLHNVADVFVHPALEEGFALTPLEAMVCGKPVIMNDSHSSREAVQDGYNGYICKTNDVNSWTSSISSLLNNNKKIQTMGNNAIKKVKKEFNWSESVNLHEKVFKRLISSERGPVSSHG